MVEKTNNIKSYNLSAVQDQYEDYPYPARNPKDESHRLLGVAGEYLGEINHWLFNGKEDFKSGFRVLIAGGGTGDALIYLAHQLRNTTAEIVYLDFSKASLLIAKERAKVRGLKNIIWLRESLLDIPILNLGTFDFIDCSGVLHHLQSPSKGLAALKSVLSERGGMSIMLYAKYGRTGIYHIQELMRRINVDVISRQQEIINTRLILNSLPASNWFKHGANLFNDIANYGDTGIYDLLLHKQDHCYSITEVYELIEQQNLNFIAFSAPDIRIGLKSENYIQDNTLLQKVKSLSILEQQAICEVIKGDITKHTFYVSNKKDVTASLSNLNNVPYFYNIDNDLGNKIAQLVNINNLVQDQNLSVRLNSYCLQNLVINIPISIFTKIILENIDGYKSLNEMFYIIKKQDCYQNISLEKFNSEVSAVLTPLMDIGVLLLRDKSIEKFEQR